MKTCDSCGAKMADDAKECPNCGAYNSSKWKPADDDDVYDRDFTAEERQKLAKSGFLRSEHGANGGYKLARDPREITALEVIRSIDGPIVLTACFTEHGFCSHTEKCNVREPLRKVHEGILKLLSSISISDMSHEGAACAADEEVAKSSARLYDLAPGLPPAN